MKPLTRKRRGFWPVVLSALLILSGSFPARAQNSKTGIQIVLTGDSIINRRLSVFDDPASTGLFDFIRNSDAAFTNFETLVIPDYDSYPGAAQSGGAYQSSPAWVADELKWAGFNLVSTANNHAFDFGVKGMRSTLRALDAAGLVHAGTGENLSFARAPGYLDTKRGRVGLIAFASTFTAGSLAGEQRPDLPGRPGVNPLRFTTSYTVDQNLFQSLQQVAALMRPGRARGRGQNQRTRVRIGGVQFQTGSTDAVTSEPNRSDLQGLIASVRDAHRQADWVIVYTHTHESGRSQEDPPEFLVTAAHAAIDAGADIFVTSGPHILRGIEIYKGKPIFYGLGNFIFENETMAFEPAESYDSLGLPWNSTPADYFDARSANDTRGFPVDKPVWESVAAKVFFNPDHTLSKITLVPIRLGFREPRSQRGRPRLASADQSKEIIDTVSRLSAPYGTKVVYSEGRGSVLADVKQR